MKFKITNDNLIEDFFAYSRLIGIIAPLNDYKFIWYVNRQFGYNFRINNSLEIQLKKKERNYFFSIYQYDVPGCCVVHYLYKNQFDGEYLLPEFKHLDFLWLIKGEEMEEEDLKPMIDTIKSLPGVQLVSEMTNEKIKNKQHLIL